jgi:hypothetical protein
MCAMVRSFPQVYEFHNFFCCMYEWYRSSWFGVFVWGEGGRVFLFQVYVLLKKFIEYRLVLFRCKYWKALLLHLGVVLDKSAHANVQCCLEDMHNLIFFLGELSILKLNNLTWLNHSQRYESNMRQRMVKANSVNLRLSFLKYGLL